MKKKKKTVKKVKKSAKKKTVKKTAKKDVKKFIQKLVRAGKVTHYYNHIKVGIIKFNRSVKRGTAVRIRGATTNFEMKIGSMQYNHKDVAVAPKNKLIGIKVSKRVREGDEVFLVQ